jgi:integrase
LLTEAEEGTATTLTTAMMTASTKTTTKNKRRRLPPLEGESYDMSIGAIVCKPTHEVYTSKLRGFMSFLHLSVKEVDKLLMNHETKLIQKCIIDFIIYLREEKQLSYSTISGYVDALKCFYDGNDIDKEINWSRIYRSLPEYKRALKDSRGYTREEIAKLLSISNEREKVIILLQCASGLRKGALPGLTLGDIKRYPEPNSYPKVYEVIVYRGTKDEYFSLTTPECSEAIENIFKSRISQYILEVSKYRYQYYFNYGS